VNRDCRGGKGGCRAAGGRSARSRRSASSASCRRLSSPVEDSPPAAAALSRRTAAHCARRARRHRPAARRSAMQRAKVLHSHRHVGRREPQSAAWRFARSAAGAGKTPKRKRAPRRSRRVSPCRAPAGGQSTRPPPACGRERRRECVRPVQRAIRRYLAALLAMLLAKPRAVRSASCRHAHDIGLGARLARLPLPPPAASRQTQARQARCAAAADYRCWTNPSGTDGRGPCAQPPARVVSRATLTHAILSANDVKALCSPSWCPAQYGPQSACPGTQQAS